MGVKRYFKREFQLSMFKLEHDPVSDFYLSCFQRNRSTLPLLIVRCIVFLGCIGIVLASQILTSRSIGYGLWWIFLTHWGLIFITVTAGFAFLVSFQAYLSGPIDATFGLPWYIKAYWASYNVTMPIAFFITLFYWIFLTELDEDYAINIVLDVFIHAMNSVMMLILLATGRHPTRILHFYFAVVAGIIYLIFSVIFHFAGGIGPFGSSAIYPMLDWARPGLASITAVGSAVCIILVHMLVVGMTAARDALTKDCRENSSSLSISNDRQMPVVHSWT